MLKYVVQIEVHVICEYKLLYAIMAWLNLPQENNNKSIHKYREINLVLAQPINWNVLSNIAHFSLEI